MINYTLITWLIILQISIVMYILIFIAIKINQIKKSKNNNQEIKALTELIKNLDNKNKCPKCKSTDLTELEDNKLSCNYCSHVFSKNS